MIMKIALDWDDTVTRDHAFWIKFIRGCLSHGHEIRIVTFRYDRQCDDIRETVSRWSIEYLYGHRVQVIPCNFQQKMKGCLDAGWMPDIWIDDRPELIPLYFSDDTK